MFKQTIMFSEINEQPKRLAECFELNRESIVQLALSAKRAGINNVVLAARGTSHHACVYFKYLFEIKAGLPCSYAYPGTVTLYGAKPNYRKSLVIGVSQSGKAADVLEIINAANAQGALTASITNYQNSPLAKASSVHLYCAAGEEISVAATKTFTTQMMILAMLAAEFAGDKAFMEELRAVPDSVAKVLGMTDTIAHEALKFKEEPDCYVLARGTNFATACETALKIQETTYIRAKAYAVSDFHHGPFAVISPGTKVILFAPKGVTQKDAKEMLAKLDGAGAETTVITDDESLAKKGTAIVLGFDMNDFVSPFYFAVAAQLFACALSVARGINPDKPRGLNKVTITK